MAAENNVAGEPIRIMVVEDHHVVRQGLIALLQTVPDFVVVAQTDTATDAIALYQKHTPAITLMDLRLKTGSGVAAIQGIRAIAPESRIIVLTTYDGDEDIHKAIQAGARSYLLKGASSEELIGAIRTVHAGRQYLSSLVAERLAGRAGTEELTSRELEVLQHIVRGRSNKEIAQEMRISEATVKSHINNLLGKLMVTDRTQAAITALQRGLVHL
jgi:two-component system NarL family response regulator